MTWEIQPFEASDFDDCLSFWKEQDGIGLTESDTSERVARFLRRNPGMSFIVREAGRVVGAVMCGHDGRRGFLYHLAVAASHRGKGLGRALVERCIARLREEGIAKCNILVFAANREGRRFWRRLRYVERDDLLMMQRQLE